MASSGNWHEMTATDVFRELGSSKTGLSAMEAVSRLSKYGPNVLQEEKGISRLRIFLNQFTNILVIILIIAAVVSVFVIGSMVDAAVIMVIVVLNGVLGYVQEFRAEKAVEMLKKMTNPESIVVREGRQMKVASRDIVPGDVVLLDEGTKIPAELRLFEVVNLKIDESLLTGESVPVAKDVGVYKGAGLPDRKCMAHMGTIATYGRGFGVVTATGMNTEMGSIAKMIQETENEQTPLQKRLKKFGEELAGIILAICAIVVFIIMLKSGAFSGEANIGDVFLSSFMIGIALAIAAIPEGLPAIVTLTMALGLQRLAKKNALVRKLPSVETLGSTSVICSDKTGTLTLNEMTVRRIYCDSRIYEVTGKGYETKGEFLFSGGRTEPHKIQSLEMTLRTGLLCNNASLGPKDTIVGDPTEGAIVVAAAKAFDIDKVQAAYPRKGEFPFSSERKMMTTINNTGTGLEAYVKGAPEVILERCSHIFTGGRAVKITVQEKEKAMETAHDMGGDALRVLAFACKRVSHESQKEAENDLVFLGLMGMIDPPRKEVKGLIESCRRAGIRSVMITGDHKNTAIAIGRELGLFREGDRALTGEDMERMDDTQLGEVVESVAIYARVSPEHKVRIVTALQKTHVVAMTGDGVNDAPALKKADIGMAMGIKGTDVAKETSEMILKDDNFGTIVAAVKEGRVIYDNIKKFIQYLLASNLGEVMIIFFALLIFTDPENPGMVIIPLTAIQLLWINLLTDGLPALALGVDPASKGVMERPPRSRNENLLDKDMMIDIAIVASLMTIGTLYIFSINLKAGIALARTAAFTSIVIFEMVKVQSVRLKYGVSFFSNWKLLLAIATSIALQLAVVYVPFLQEAFGTTALGLADWEEIISMAFGLMIILMARWRFFPTKRPEMKTDISGG